jgi:hypothetical protein
VHLQLLCATLGPLTHCPGIEDGSGEGEGEGEGDDLLVVSTLYTNCINQRETYGISDEDETGGKQVPVHCTFWSKLPRSKLASFAVVKPAEVYRVQAPVERFRSKTVQFSLLSQSISQA